MSPTIHYRGEPVAEATAAGATLIPRLEKASDDDPVKRVVLAMLIFELGIRSGDVPGPYSDDRAEQYARILLIDDDEFLARVMVGANDEQLAAHFQVPVEQIRAKLDDLNDDPAVIPPGEPGR